MIDSGEADNHGIDFRHGHGEPRRFLTVGEQARTAAGSLVRDLRSGGVSAAVAFEDRPLKAQLKMADKADAEFQAKLKTFREGLTAAKEDTKLYGFVLTNAIDAVGSGATDHRKLLDEQEEMAKHKKKKKND